ncbi:MAG: hypothetical protein SCARUB_02244 [Candidatus Scalindua rubra]|uniref:Uncharacterized protein n=1 Tax=Candidatus Scalindua rubra TaxID=1872076 RepID=A0A1E3XAL4_9BACT|nr:MAG: hypothetical protein SCARUB_02244 [Candidatus Scalindua rubra]
MLTWEGLLGKMLSFMVKEFSKKAIKKLGDKKNLVSETFMRLYVSIAELEGITDLILNDTDHSIKDKSTDLLISTIKRTERSIEAHTNLLTDTAIQLGFVLDIYDPKLNEALSSICSWKFNILFEASKTIVLEHVFYITNWFYTTTLYFRYTISFASPSNKLIP